MGIYKSPCDALKLSNTQLLDMFDQWEAEHDLILLNGDILEVLKSARVKFSHVEQTHRVIDDRQVVVERILGSDKFLWTVGNHDHTLEQVLGLPLSIKMELDHGYTLVAEHGHLLRAPKSHYSTYAWHFHLMYCLSWWIDKLGMKLAGEQFCLDTVVSRSLISWPNKANSKLWRDRVKVQLVKLAQSYASLNSDSGYASLNQLFVEQAQTHFNPDKTLVTYGHSHDRQINRFANGNVYLNTGHFCRHNNYSVMVFSTATGELVSVDQA
jgi:UDP-2,3-diacylglucosamine pyrophosphatase LpxH